jgi:glucosamine kinase
LGKDIVVGIDGGGTYTRVVVADIHGNVLGFSKKSGSHPDKNENPVKNVKTAIVDALEKSNNTMESVKCIVGGFAGLNHQDDLKWAKELTDLPDLLCPKLYVNDAEIAQIGAFLDKEGILAIAGTGSIVLGKTEYGSIVKSLDFHHDTEAAARFLSYSVIYQLISEKIIKQEDQNLVQQVLSFWNLRSIEELRMLAVQGFSSNKISALKKMSEMAPIVTTSAEKGSLVSYKACSQLVESLIIGIQLVSTVFTKRSVPLAFVGGVINTKYVNDLLINRLDSKPTIKRFNISTPNLSPVLGAIIKAYHYLNIDLSEDIIKNLLVSDKINTLYQ